MILDAKLSNKFWVKAVNVINYLHNLLPEIEFGSSESFWNTGVCSCSKEKGLKPDPLAVKMIFFGYSDSHKGYWLIDLKTYKLVVCRDVLFVLDDMMPDY